MTISIKHWLMVLPAIFVAWLALLAAVMRVSGAAPAALVLLPSAGLLSGLPDGVAITARGSFSVTVASAMPDLVSSLYAAGAVIVLPAGLAGCIPQR